MSHNDDVARLGPHGDDSGFDLPEASSHTYPPMHHYSRRLDRDQVYSLISKEREWQDRKWGRPQGEWDAPAADKFLVLSEEVGEVARAILEQGPGDMLHELVQAAAVIVAWLESLPEGYLP